MMKVQTLFTRFRAMKDFDDGEENETESITHQVEWESIGHAGNIRHSLAVMSSSDDSDSKRRCSQPHWAGSLTESPYRTRDDMINVGTPEDGAASAVASVRSEPGRPGGPGSLRRTVAAAVAMTQ
eukprot:766529-Hanusia_phi.AAC.1